MNSNIKKQLKKMRVNPLTQQEKDAVWKQVCLGMAVTPQKTSHKLHISSMFKRSIALTLIFGMTMGTASAANEAKPGDVLFPLDRAMENAHLYIVSNEKKDELKVKFALERVEEVKEILGEISTKTKIKEAEKELIISPSSETPGKAKETPPTSEEGDLINTQILPEITEVSPPTEKTSKEETPENSKINSSGSEIVETIDIDEQVGSSSDDLPTGIIETDTASSSEQENLEDGGTKILEMFDSELSQNGSTTKDVSKDQEQGVQKIDMVNLEMSDMDKKRIELALSTALDFLGCVKSELAEQGNYEAASSIDNLLKELNAEIETLPENIIFEVKLSSKKQKVQFEITSEDDKDVVQLVEVPVDENNEEGDGIERLDEVSAEPKETKLEIKDGTLSIKTEGDDDSLEEEKTDDEKVVDEKTGESEDEQPVDEKKDPAITEEGSGVVKQEQSTTTDDVLNDDENPPTDEEDDGTTTVKVIIKKLDEDLEFSITDQDGNFHKIIEEYTDEKGDAVYSNPKKILK